MTTELIDPPAEHAATKKDFDRAALFITHRGDGQFHNKFQDLKKAVTYYHRSGKREEARTLIAAWRGNLRVFSQLTSSMPKLMVREDLSSLTEKAVALLAAVPN